MNLRWQIAYLVGVLLVVISSSYQGRWGSAVIWGVFSTFWCVVFWRKGMLWQEKGNKD